MSTVGKPIQCLAAVAWAPQTPLSVETITVAPPKRDEVRIKVLWTGLCHTDTYTLSGQDSEGVFPVVLGHEGGGIVESVGEGVTDVKVGDHVIPLYTAECKSCKFCKSGKTNLCGAVRETQGKGLMTDGTSRFSAKGKDLFHYMGCSTFSQYTVVTKHSVVAVDKSADLRDVCLLGCAITTGYGAAIKTAEVTPGSTCAIFGLGAIGLSVLQGCLARGASQVICIDTNPSKEAWMRKFDGGKGEFVNPRALKEGTNIVDEVVRRIDGGADYTFDCTGNTTVMRQALESCHKGWGTSTIIGVAPAGAEISTRPFQLVTGRRWIGSAFGGIKGKSELPGLVSDYKKGVLKVKDFITHATTLKDINKGLGAMKSGDCVRCVVDMSSEEKARL
ncbi:hypothetical protein MNV49_004866 [Pseudohyphozyma bogoriensis]|nr:hypothetical protein MNV49_004866 [Pseudohyphozyma bogoriensis]